MLYFFFFAVAFGQASRFSSQPAFWFLYRSLPALQSPPFPPAENRFEISAGYSAAVIHAACEVQRTIQLWFPRVVVLSACVRIIFAPPLMLTVPPMSIFWMIPKRAANPSCRPSSISFSGPRSLWTSYPCPSAFQESSKESIRKPAS